MRFYFSYLWFTQSISSNALSFVIPRDILSNLLHYQNWDASTLIPLCRNTAPSEIDVQREARLKSCSRERYICKIETVRLRTAPSRRSLHWFKFWSITILTIIGKINKVFLYCTAVKFKNESPECAAWVGMWNWWNYK